MPQKSDKPRGVFDDFSFSAVVASALTAATSFLLSSKIGLAGSLIGAMAAAVISTACTQVYKGMLTASAERIREVAEPSIAYGQHASAPRVHHTPSHELGRFARRLVVFAACVSLAAVLASAAVIGFATRGAGLGPTTWEPVAVVDEAKEAATEAKETASEVKQDAAAVADKVETKLDELVEEQTAESEALADTVASPDSSSDSSSDSSPDASQPSVASEAAGDETEASAEEPATEQEQPLTDQGLSESDAVPSTDAAQ